MTTGPGAAGFEAFAAGWTAGRPQVVVRRLVDDLETPVSAYLKVGHGRPYAFLLESVEGGAVNGRYSIITRDPDVIWRCRDGRAEQARGPAIAAGHFTAEPGPALESLRALIAATRFDLPDDLPPMPPRGEPTGVIKPQRGIPRDGRKIVTKAEREHTPPALASWLVELARRAAKCGPRWSFVS